MLKSTFVVSLLALAVLALGATAPPGGVKPNMPNIEKKSCPTAEKVVIVYSAAGGGEPGLVFIHGGLADRTFWDAELRAFAGAHRVVAVDLPGHGESGAPQKRWSLPDFGAAVRDVVRAEGMKRVILLGNSLGGPVAVEAALLLSGAAIGVIGVDTFNSLGEGAIPAKEARARAEAFHADYAGQVKAMTRMLFHPDADPAVFADAESRMLKTSPNTSYQMFMAMAGYDPDAAVRKLTVPLRAVNGDLYPTDTAAIRKVKPDFEALVMKHMGHYPMLERPDEFNRLLAKVIAGLGR